MLKSKNVPFELFHQAKYFINLKLLWNEDKLNLEEYIREHNDSPFILDAVNQLLRYYKFIEELDKELSYFNQYLEKFSYDPWFLNQYAWRMTELSMDLENALHRKKG